MKIALLGDVSMAFFAPDFRRDGYSVYLAPGFDTWRQELLDPASGLYRFAPDAVLLVRHRVDGPVPGDTGLAICDVDLAALARETPGFYDERLARAAGFPFSLAGLQAIADEFRWFLAARPAKVLALDADNTLWRGIAVEEEAEAPLAPFVDFQRGVRALRDRGVVLALFSKNDWSCLRRVLARPEMVLKEEDFAYLGVNWSPKAGNLLAAAQTLNLGCEAFVFLDDNAFERAEMRARVPSVAVPPYGPAVCTGATLRRLATYFFADLGQTPEDRRRAAMYREEAARRAAADRSPALADYLRGLDLRARFAPAGEGDIPRLAQMAGKTNQFNATTRRRTAEEFARLLRDPAQRVWAVRAGDRYGDMGLVCYVVYDTAAARVTDFVMSCRAMGRTLEGFVLNAVRAALAAEGRALTGIDFVATAKNGPFQRFLETLDLAREQDTFFTAEDVV